MIGPKCSARSPRHRRPWRLLADVDEQALAFLRSARASAREFAWMQAAPTYRGGFGFHPLLCFPADTGEALSGRPRPGNAGANTASDHITVFGQALAPIPDAHRHGAGILVRTHSAGSAKAFLARIRDMCGRGVRTFSSVGYAITEPVR